MKKIDFISMVLSVFGTLIFGTGMSLAMIPEWNMMKEGIIVGCLGLLVLLVMVLVRRKMQGKKLVKFNKRIVGYTLYTTIAFMVFGSGLTMTIMSKSPAEFADKFSVLFGTNMSALFTSGNIIMLGIVLGIIGIGMLMYLIVMLKGIKD